MKILWVVIHFKRFFIHLLFLPSIVAKYPVSVTILPLFFITFPLITNHIINTNVYPLINRRLLTAIFLLMVALLTKKELFASTA